MYATWILTVASLKMLVRDRAALVGTVAFPLLVVATFSLFDMQLAGGTTFTPGPGVDYFDYVFPGLLAMGLMNFTMVGIAGSIARFRELQILRRIRATPLPPSRFVIAQIAARLVLAVGQLALMAGVGLILGADVAGSWLALLVLATAGNLVFLSLGFAIAGRADSVEAANNLAGLVTAPLMFLSGMFFPTESMPALVQRIAEVLPITPLIDAMRAVSLDGASLGALGTDGLALLLWIPAGLLIARLGFRFAAD
jgi:ABC-2 type transport system permease protein